MVNAILIFTMILLFFNLVNLLLEIKEKRELKSKLLEIFNDLIGKKG